MRQHSAAKRNLCATATPQQTSDRGRMPNVHVAGSQQAHSAQVSVHSRR